jgi:hypothetical protein
MTQENRAPRFHEYLDSKRYLRMAKLDIFGETQIFPIKIDILTTPLANLAKIEPNVKAFVDCLDGEIFIKIFREHQIDFPKCINVDTYRVSEFRPDNEEYMRAVVACSTMDDSALRSYNSDYIYFKLEDKGEDHHLTEIPPRYKAIL